MTGLLLVHTSLVVALRSSSVLGGGACSTRQLGGRGRVHLLMRTRTRRVSYRTPCGFFFSGVFIELALPFKPECGSRTSDDDYWATDEDDSW